MAHQRRICSIFVKKKTAASLYNALKTVRPCCCEYLERLSHDLLWYIFSLNAEMGDLQQEDGVPEFETSPLTTLRWTSQVCRSWRRLVLNSPSLWGSVIDLAVLYQKEGHWRELVLERTGKSLLCVSGEVDGTDDEEFLAWCNSLLHHEWERLRRVDMRCWGSDDFFFDIWHDLLTRPTKHLESFVVEIGSSSPSLSTMFTNLFSGGAPSLRRLGLHEVLFSLKTPFIPQLTTLWLSYNEGTPKLDVREIFDVLRSTPHLSSLALIKFVEDSQSTTQKIERTALPELRELTNVGPIGPSLLVLDNVLPRPGCKLYLESMNISISPEQRESLVRLVGRYSLSYFEMHPSRRIFYDIDGDNFVCGAYPPSEPSNPTFCVAVLSDFDVEDGTRQLTPFLLGMLQFGRSLSTVSTLDFTGERFIFDDYSTELLHFMSSFPSLQTLVTMTSTFYNTIIGLSWLAGPDSHVFSTLRKLDIDSLSLPRQESEVPSLYLKFFQWRCEAGHPMESLDITRCYRSVGLQSLENVKGLKVIWVSRGKEKTYVCGSGTPDVLDFSRPSLRWIANPTAYSK